MNRYTGDGEDPYIDPATGILRNLVGARTQKELDRIEGSYAGSNAYLLDQSPIVGRFDFDHLLATHKALFGNVYDWAGSPRTIDIYKGTSWFAHCNVLESAGKQLFNQLARENHLQSLDADQFSKRAGFFLGEVNVLHPAREGNGRTQRAFFSQLARQAGYRIAWSDIARADMTQASIDAYRGDAEPMGRLIRGALSQRTDHRLTDASRLAEPNTSHLGEIKSVEAKGSIIQLVDGQLIEHKRDRLVGQTDLLQPGKIVNIVYSNGIGQVIETLQQRKPRRR